MTEIDSSPDKPEFPKKGSNGSGTLRAYSIEARYDYPSPRMFAGNMLDGRWRTIEFTKVSPPFGVPSGRGYNAPWLLSTGLFEYQAAQALRWWFLAAAETEFSCGCIETRLIEHELKYSYGTTALKATAPIGGEDRSGIMPDWGTKPPPLPRDPVSREKQP